MKGVKALIEKLMEEDARCRNDDKWLTYRVFQEIAKENGQGIFIPFNLFDKFPAFETVKRTRANIQNKEKRHLPYDSVSIKRGQEVETIDPRSSLFVNSQLS